MKIIILPVYLLLSIALWYCANPVTPTGGNKDITPPAITFTNPINRSINSNPSIVTFKFNENIQVNNAKEQIVVSPKPLLKAEIKTGSSQVTLLFKEGALSNNTTYSINLNESIRDLNESNQGTFPPYLFSTGNLLDTLSIKGRCFFIEKPKTQKVKILSLSNNPYRSITDKSLKFTLPGLPGDSLLLLAYNDLNSNDSFELNEDAGLVKSKPGDSINIAIYPLQRKKISLYKYDKLIYGLSGYNNNGYHNGVIHFKDTLIGDSTSIFTLINKIDSTRFIVPRKAEKKSYKIKYSLIKPSFLTDSFQLLKIVANDRFLKKDSKKQAYLDKLKKTDTCNVYFNANTITYQFKNNHAGNISIPFEQETENKKAFNDTLKTNIPVYTSLVIHNNEIFGTFVSIKNKNTEEVSSRYLEPGESLKLWVLPTDYDVSYYADKNRNSKLDGPDFSNKIPGEYYRRLPELRIKENMAIELKLKDAEKP